jgi:hypothetical protein
MITAKEAKQLYDESGAEVDHFLKHTAEINVVSAAKSGKRKVEILIGTTGPFEYVDQKITPLEKAIITKLKELGYTAKIENYGDSYVPRGLADDDGNGPSHRNYGFIIGW